MSSHHDFIEMLSSHLEEWDYKLDRLEHRFRDLPKEIKAEFNSRLAKLQHQRASLILKLKEAESDLETNVEQSVEDIELTIAAMDALFKDLSSDVKVEFS